MTDRETELLAKLRKHPKFGALLGTLDVDRGDWASNEAHANACKQLDVTPDPMDAEDYPGEARDHRESYDLLYELLTGQPYGFGGDEGES